jgi:hypothetical protein
LLAKYEKTNKNIQLAAIDEDFQSRPGYKKNGHSAEGEDAYSTKNDTEDPYVNPRLQNERLTVKVELPAKKKGATIT